MLEFLVLVLFKEVFVIMVICRINKAVVFKAFLENDVDLIGGFLDKIGLTGRLLQERYGRFTKRCLTHYLDCAYLAALRGDISAEIVDLIIKRVSQCVNLPAFAQFVLAKIGSTREYSRTTTNCRRRSERQF